jgi:hypothetical protein
MSTPNHNIWYFRNIRGTRLLNSANWLWKAREDRFRRGFSASQIRQTQSKRGLLPRPPSKSKARPHFQPKQGVPAGALQVQFVDVWRTGGAKPCLGPKLRDHPPMQSQPPGRALADPVSRIREITELFRGITGLSDLLSAPSRVSASRSVPFRENRPSTPAKTNRPRAPTRARPTSVPLFPRSLGPCFSVPRLPRVNPHAIERSMHEEH